MEDTVHPKPLRIAIAGCGSSREFYSEIRDSRGAWELVAIADHDDSFLREGSRLWNCQATEKSAEALLDNHRPDVLLICTPPQTHCDLVVAAATRGIHTLVQKPLATTTEEVQRIRDTCATQHVALRVSFYKRFVSAFQAAAVETTNLGPDGILRITWNSSSGLRPRTTKRWKEDAGSGGGILADLGPHIVDTAHWWLGDFVGGTLGMTVGRYGGVDSSIAAILRHDKGGSTLCYLSNIEERPRETYEYTNRNGGFILTQTTTGYPGSWKFDSWRIDTGLRETREFETPVRNPFIEELADFVASLKHPQVDCGNHGARTVEVTKRLYSSPADRSWPT